MTSWISLMNGEILVEKMGENNNGTAIIEMGTIIECNLKGFYLQRNNEATMTLENLQLVSQDSLPFEILVNQRFQIGEGDCIPGLELALKYAIPQVSYKMRTTSKFAYGSDGRCPLSTTTGNSIPPNSDLEYEILVTCFETEAETKPETETNTDADTNTNTDNVSVQEFHKQCHDINKRVMLRKECGNRWFYYNEYNRASRSYQKGLQIAESFFSSLEEVNDDMMDVESYRNLINSRLSCLNNLSSCHLFNKQYIKAREVCIAVLEIEPTNKKALLRAARASQALHCYEESEICLKRLLEIEPDNIAALQQVKGCKEAIKVSKVKELEFAKSMINAKAKEITEENKKENNQQSSSQLPPPLPLPQTTIINNTIIVESEKQATSFFVYLSFIVILLVLLLIGIWID